MIAIVDYGMGNLRSVEKAVERVGGQAVITAEPEMLQAAQGMILPGVGAFGDAMQNLRARRLVKPLLRQITAGKPFLGICLGMQLLFEESEEMGHHQGLGLLRGQVVRLPSAPLRPCSPAPLPPCSPAPLRVPHTGWNQLHIRQESPLLTGVTDGSYAYFVHSYYVAPADEAIVLATTDYGRDYASVVARGNLFGVQFHPEKSQEVGLRMLRNFVAMVGQRVPR
ncbi:MAG: imidazole glycerol phosphate synthase subunit HisH [Chloroflexi bacterium]|nr:imidazole glycerol phosphate synthase subunit HisH [Chloroflexota bacterium]